MRRLLLRLAAAAAWAVLGPGAPADARSGPVLVEAVPEAVPPGAAFADWPSLGAGRWPEGFLAAARDAARRSGGVLLVGQTDPLGPRSLNRALGLEYARVTAHRLARELPIEPWRVAVASRGEGEGAAPGVAAYPWPVPEPAPTPVEPVTVLSPGPQAGGGRLWALWQPASRVAWGVGEGDGHRLWEIPPAAGLFDHPLPGGVPATLGAEIGGAPVLAPVPAHRPAEDPALALRVVAADSWSARLSASVPAGYESVRVWSGGVPYPVPRGADRSVEATVALLPHGNRARLEARAADGALTVGPELRLPDGEGPSPVLWAVLTWEGDGLDLDLHGWAGEGHTRPDAPDPAFDPRSVPGSRLLFDGDGRSPASALVAWDDVGLRVEARCFSDLGGRGGRAWLYVAERPGDPVSGRFRVYGPRRLSEAPLRWRWPAHGFPGTGSGR